MPLSSEEVRQPLDRESEELIAVAMNGYSFAEYAAGRLCSIHHCWTEGRYWMLMSCFARKDRTTPRIYLNDWKHQDRLPKAQVSKFVPGEHYHVLGTKFDTLDLAIEYLHARGYRYAGLEEKYVYREE